MFNTQINLLSLLVLTVFSMVLGFLWYSKYLFGNAWMKLSGITIDRINESQSKMWKFYALSFIGTTLELYILAVLVNTIGSIGFVSGVIFGFIIWLGFVAPLNINSVLWEGKPWKLYFINTLYHAFVLMFSGGIFSVWI